MQCSVCGHKRSDVSYFRFPKDPQRLTAWLIRLKVKRNEINRQSRVCSKHFQPDCFERDLKGELLGDKSKRTLKPDALPIRPGHRRKGRPPNRWIASKEMQVNASLFSSVMPVDIYM